MNVFYAFICGDNISREFELYQAASNDWCVSVYEFDKREDYNLGSREKALEFILSYTELPVEI